MRDRLILVSGDHGQRRVQDVAIVVELMLQDFGCLDVFFGIRGRHGVQQEKLSRRQVRPRDQGLRPLTICVKQSRQACSSVHAGG